MKCICDKNCLHYKNYQHYKSCLHRMYSLQADSKVAYSSISPERARYVARANDKNDLTF